MIPAPATISNWLHLFLSGRFVALALLSVQMALVLALLVAGGGDAANTATEGAGQVRGRVVEVVGRSIVELETLRIRDEAGMVWTFSAPEGFIGLTPSHLREHQLLGRSVLVTYVSRGDELVAMDLSD